MEGYELYYSLESGGNRFAVMTCSRCGAAVILDSTEYGPRIHDIWHSVIEGMMRADDPDGENKTRATESGAALGFSEGDA